MKKLFNLNYFYFVCLCFLGGILDTFSLNYKGQVFSLIQTGNLIKSIMNYVSGNFDIANFCMILFAVFVVSCFILFIVFNYLRKKNVKMEILVPILIVICLIPSFVLTTDNDSEMNLTNILCGTFLSVGGAILFSSFTKVNSINASNTMMTANSKKMMENLAEFTISKNKEKLYNFVLYFILLITFSLGVLSVALCYNLIKDVTIGYYINIGIILFTLVVLLTLGLTIHLKKEKEDVGCKEIRD